MCEKISETQLSNLLLKNDFNQEFIYYSINNNEILKDLFKYASKSGNNTGYPDRIYFDNTNLIIFECKSNIIKNPLQNAINDIKHYINKILIQLKDNIIYNIYGIAFISENNYIIYHLKNNNLIKLENKLLIPNTFNLIKSNFIIDMNKQIKIINQYIYNNTKISNEDKPFFIAIILISIKKESFKQIIKNYNEKRYIYDLLKENIIEYNIDISIFEKFRNDNNNNHFYNIIKMIIDIFETNPTIDLLNEFYSAFVKYNNNDGKSLGIVLTPNHIIELMVELLEINENDIILDLCTGTGSFLLESWKYKPKKIIGCEYQNKLYTLFKCNIILREITNYECIKGDCFENKFKATKSIINPPYGIKSNNEYEFILKQLESVEEGGLVSAIIPISKLNDNKINNKYKKELLEKGIIKTIIICNKNLFYPNANIHCIIIIIEKNKNGNQKNKTQILDYKEDGFILQKQSGLIKTKIFNEKKIKIRNEYKNKLNNLKELKYNKSK